MPANPIVASASPVIIYGLGATTTITLTQAQNEHGMVVSGVNPLVATATLAPTTPDATVGLADVGQTGTGANTAVLAAGYALTITPVRYGSTEIIVEGDGGTVLTIPLFIYPIAVSAPFPPTILALAQVVSGTSPAVFAAITQSPTTGTYPISSLNLYRSPSPTGPFTLVASQALSSTSIINELLDPNPIISAGQFYVATAVDTSAEESAYSNVMQLAVLNPIISTGPFPPGSPALGPYPLLGSDIFLNPATGEGVIGPNGDILTVNGLYLLAQDLGIRLRTEIGELALHPLFGFTKGKTIGRGQGRPDLQAQVLAADVKECLFGDPRVLSVDSVKVTQEGTLGTGWLIAYTVTSIYQEDPLNANLVVGYY